MLIPLSQGKFTIIDDEDYDVISKYKWHVQKNKNTFYAVTTIRKPDGTRTTLRMHRLLLGLKKGEQCDHINNNGLDNRRCNIRLVTNQQNQMNQQKHKNCFNLYKGVCFHKRVKKWQSNIAINGKKIHLGYFTTEIEAGKVYDLKAKELFGKYAHLNFPD